MMIKLGIFNLFNSTYITIIVTCTKTNNKLCSKKKLIQIFIIRW